MKLTIPQIEQIATLARLELSDAEKERYAEQLSAIFDYIELLNEVNTEGVEETTQVTGLVDVVRADESKKSSDDMRKKIIEAFPERFGDLLKVKAVFDKE